MEGISQSALRQAISTPHDLQPQHILVGCAGWSIPKGNADQFPDNGSHLERYAQVFAAVEINSSFYRPHRRTTYERWAASVPDSFRFSVKFPRSVTHERRLIDCEELVEQFVSEIAGLGDRLGVVLVQLPPSLRFDSDIAARFFRALREWTHAPIAFEPRHRTWFTSEVDVLLTEHDISRVAADPPVVPAAAVPGGSSRVAYYRLHGSPRMYYSSYEPSFLADLAGRLASYREPDHVWCIFDNTAANAAIENGLRLLVMLRTPVCDSRPVC